MTPLVRILHQVEYPESDDMGEHFIQRLILEVLRPLVERWTKLTLKRAFVGADQFVYFVEGDLSKRRAPDVYVIEGVAQDIAPPSVWKTWEGHRPNFVFESSSQRWKKDYVEAPADYDAMGVREAIIFDPFATSRSRKRVRWQVFRRVQGKGLRCVEQSSGDRVRSAELGCFLRAVDDGRRPLVRVAIGPAGDELLPTDAEVLAAERAALTLERASRAIAEAQAAAEREARRDAEAQVRVEQGERRSAEAKIAALEAEIDALRRGAHT